MSSCAAGSRNDALDVRGSTSVALAGGCSAKSMSRTSPEVPDSICHANSRSVRLPQVYGTVAVVAYDCLVRQRVRYVVNAGLVADLQYQAVRSQLIRAAGQRVSLQLLCQILHRCEAVRVLGGDALQVDCVEQQPAQQHQHRHGQRENAQQHEQRVRPTAVRLPTHGWSPGVGRYRTSSTRATRWPEMRFCATTRTRVMSLQMPSPSVVDTSTAHPPTGGLRDVCCHFVELVAHAGAHSIQLRLGQEAQLASRVDVATHLGVMGGGGDEQYEQQQQQCHCAQELDPREPGANGRVHTGMSHPLANVQMRFRESRHHAPQYTLPMTDSSRAISGKKSATTKYPTTRPQAKMSSGPMMAASICSHRMRNAW